MVTPSASVLKDATFIEREGRAIHKQARIELCALLVQVAVENA